jgi:hypothetical protein
MNKKTAINTKEARKGQQERRLGRCKKYHSHKSPCTEVL